MKLAMTLICVVSLTLVGCSSAPSELDIKSALAEQMEKIASGGAKAFAERASDFKLIGCSKADVRGYHCDWSSKIGAGAGRFVKSDGGWILVGT